MGDQTTRGCGLAVSFYAMRELAPIALDRFSERDPSEGAHLRVVIGRQGHLEHLKLPLGQRENRIRV
jgi:hypothetical protein